ncbi:pyridoxal phosphate-dependent aminotransferase [Enteractinococcus coprophilus]|uniref:Aminotransferase n=1 Tax=Enteractinococcus coprophilus TaxID=1027633 RepID=A0A543ANL7_9MICC|nr:aminotransferase class I/II-fold pyridoxal phosphate-dependent enzyme [Enteractinococcus coprophilus]TQL74171.1 aspartate/methionine/tyrosine aminotransferase [Enteractinococcus coprophilus]
MAASQFSPSRRSAVARFQVMDIVGDVDAMKAQGVDVISLGAGEPSGGAPAAVNREAARLHNLDSPVFNYTPSLGIKKLREAIARHYKDWYDLDVDYESVAVMTGSSGAFVSSFIAAFDVGDRVGLARPGYPAYRNILRALDVDVVDLPAGVETNFRFNVDRLAAFHAEQPLDGLILASPNNPTGTMVPREDMRQIATWCAESGVRLVSDEIYHGITYGEDRGASAWEFDRNAIVISSFSKYWGMPGWRLGWMLMPQDLQPAVSGLAGSISLCPPAASQHAAVEAFSAEAYAESDAEVAEFARTRQLVLDNVDRLGWRNAAPADGAFYYYAQPSAKVLARYGNTVAYAADVLKKAHVALVPGVDFDGVDGDQYIRISFAAGYDNVARAIERLVEFDATID